AALPPPANFQPHHQCTLPPSSTDTNITPVTPTAATISTTPSPHHLIFDIHLHHVSTSPHRHLHLPTLVTSLLPPPRRHRGLAITAFRIRLGFLKHKGCVWFNNKHQMVRLVVLNSTKGAFGFLSRR
nr:hypothetical protein [Tanacetum cinerariifolium]